jgi:hypothetical protein
LEQLLAKNDYKGFQEVCIQAISPSTTSTASATKEFYHFLLKTLGERPQAFASVATTATGSAEQGSQENLDPLNSAIGILTDMCREANVTGKAEVQPDQETLKLVLQVAGGGSGGGNDWESTRILVDAVRHGRLPALLSLDQWELPDLDIPLDQALWKSMFECIHSAAAGTGVAGERKLDVMTFLMADQLTRLQDVEMDDDLWGYVLQVCSPPLVERTMEKFSYANFKKLIRDFYLIANVGIWKSEISSKAERPVAKTSCYRKRIWRKALLERCRSFGKLRINRTGG